MSEEKQTTKYSRLNNFITAIEDPSLLRTIAIFYEDGSELTFEQCSLLIKRLSAYLQAEKLSNKLVVSFMRHSLELFLFTLSSFESGVLFAPMNSQFKTSELENILKNFGSISLFLIDEELLPIVENFSDETLSQIDKFVLVDTRLQSGDVKRSERLLHPNLVTMTDRHRELRGKKFIHFEELIVQGTEQNFVKMDIEEDRIAIIRSTSGSTGPPKSVVHTHKSLADSVQSFLDRYQAESAKANEKLKEKGLTEWPKEEMPLFFASARMFYSGGASFLYIRAGLPILLLREPFEINRAVEQLSKYKPTMFVLISTFLASLLRHPDIKNTSCFARAYFVGTGGDYCPSGFKEELAKLTPALFMNGYGSSECLSSIQPIPSKDPTCIGFPSGLGELRIVGDDGQVIKEPWKIGELQQRGGSLFQGYYNQPELTKASFTDDGFYRTNDLVCYDERGALYFRGRKKLIIMRRGNIVYPEEIEEVFQITPKPETASSDAQLPVVKLAAAISVPDIEEEGSAPKVYLEFDRSLVDMSREQRKELVDRVFLTAKEKIADYKLPREVVLLHRIPLTGNGKLAKKELELISESGDESSPLFIDKFSFPIAF